MSEETISAVGSWVKPEVLRWARERLNLTTQQVAEESQTLTKYHFTPIDVSDLARWERGEAEPDLEHLETLAEIYSCPVGWFFLREIPEESLPVTFRGLAKPREQLSPESQRTLRRFMELAAWTVSALRSSEVVWEVKIKPAEVAPDLARVDAIAEEYRKRFGWTQEIRGQFEGDSRAAFRWWRRKIESCGVFCFELPLDPTEARGVAMWHEGYPFILVNRQDREAAAGRIFTLLHEFAHLISSREGVVCDFHGTHHKDHNPEPFANRFSARVLVNPDELLERLREIGVYGYRDSWSDDLLDRIRAPFSVSRDVISILLQELQWAPTDFYDTKRQQWQSRKPWGRGGKRPRLNEQKLREVGYSFAHLLTRLANSSNLSLYDTASILGMKVDKVDKFLEWLKEQDEEGR